MDYTVISDTVNITARLERKAKELNLKTLISKATVEQSALTSLTQLEDVSLKGKTNEITVFTDED
ncbi:adenylate/guanylate cyclase domain-containing protein [Pseudoalteromonas sp. G4]|uniref:adenylate/guanylate cyclase domain-containing protein n=1 Tax=Pseudoalteromonas sp. G4 TaxID=2992761 RepID=UPI00237D98FE|nr:adenylate/guanylate cyclase domain-containing protein [Pseudoalteromonas sp. G4]MDE3270865.1 hypothetical protein [Pseudoalteromonas sp. G4]